MYKYNNCGGTFEEPKICYELHGFTTGSGEKLTVCPFCDSTGFEEYTEPEPYNPDLAEVSKAIIKGIFHLNNLRYALEDIFGSAMENKELEKSCDCFFNALDIITSEEGMDENVLNLIIEAKVLDSRLFKACDNFLEGAGLYDGKRIQRASCYKQVGTL